jgi:very-short-patch-repair endonuclease
MKDQAKKDVLIALMNNKKDFAIAQEQGWYRIPVKSAPQIVRDDNLKNLAFYQTKIFGEEAFSIRWFGEVKRMTIVQRKELFPDLQTDPKADNEYYKIEFDKLQQLSEPIVSHRLRRILFISTTLSRFQNAKEINDVFYESPIEETIWEVLKAEKIAAERQYLVGTDKQFFYLDFALFCKDRNIDVECDGDTFHSNPNDVKRDKKRNNLLESLGWSVLRFTTDEIFNQLKETVKLMKQTINRYGGLAEINAPMRFRQFTFESGHQPSLFD